MQRKQKGRQQHAAGRPAAGDIEADLVRLSSLALGELRATWMDRFRAAPPPIRSRDVLLRLMAWRIQSQVSGDLDAKTVRTLRDVAAALDRDGTYKPKIRRDLSPGVELTREWKGTIHKVTVTPDGFQHLGKRYRSLSDIARTITGTRWSGPRFFGLEQVARPGTGPPRTPRARTRQAEGMP
ncbi:MAG TPA: DUF2924 domain-containing protein [Rhizomicrobium sp.]|jgi:hypothetical protein